MRRIKTTDQQRGTLSAADQSTARRSKSRSPPARLEWSPYAAWSGEQPAEACELALYALLWLDSVAVACPPHLRAARCAELLDPVVWQRVEARRSEPIPMAALVAAAKRGSEDRVVGRMPEALKPQSIGSGGGIGSVHGSGAMAVLGPSVYAWAQYEQLLDGLPPSWSASWRNAELTPR